MEGWVGGCWGEYNSPDVIIFLVSEGACVYVKGWVDEM